MILECVFKLGLFEKYVVIKYVHALIIQMKIFGSNAKKTFIGKIIDDGINI